MKSATGTGQDKTGLIHKAGTFQTILPYFAIAWSINSITVAMVAPALLEVSQKKRLTPSMIPNCLNQSTK